MKNNMRAKGIYTSKEEQIRVEKEDGERAQENRRKCLLGADWLLAQARQASHAANMVSIPLTEPLWGLSYARHSSRD